MGGLGSDRAGQGRGQQSEGPAQLQRCRDARGGPRTARVRGQVTAGGSSRSEGLLRPDQGWRRPFLVGAYIGPYEFARDGGHEPERERKLLLHRREIDRIGGQIAEKGPTLVPLQVYFKDGAPRSNWAWPRARPPTTNARPSGNGTPTGRWRERLARDANGARGMLRPQVACETGSGRVGPRVNNL